MKIKRGRQFQIAVENSKICHHRFVLTWMPCSCCQSSEWEHRTLHQWRVQCNSRILEHLRRDHTTSRQHRARRLECPISQSLCLHGNGRLSTRKETSASYTENREKYETLKVNELPRLKRCFSWNSHVTRNSETRQTVS